MTRQESRDNPFEVRRHKEHVAFLVVKFLRMYAAFREIAAEFNARADGGTLAGSGLFEKVRDLARGNAFDVKELAHRLFRNEGLPPSTRPAAHATRKVITGMRGGIERRSIDSYIGTSFHLLLILQESLYQIEHYTPELQKEAGEIGRAFDLTRATGARIRADAKEDLDRLRVLDETGATLGLESTELARIVMRRCTALLDATARVIRGFIASDSNNEILVLNLLQNRELIDVVYGPGAAEMTFSVLCGGPGGDGLACALAFVRSRCGNVSALEAAPASSKG
jgi:hypothetical protein